jgi:hypothetical protein
MDAERERFPQQATADAELEEAVRGAAAEREERERALNPDTGVPGGRRSGRRGTGSSAPTRTSDARGRSR